MLRALLILNVLHFLLLALHDIVPMGRWTDFERLRVANSAKRRYLSGLINGVTGIVPLIFVWRAAHTWGTAASRHDLEISLCVLGFLLVGEWMGWWRFYLLGASAATAERLGRITAGTYTFLPVRNGITVNAFHCVLHAITLLCLGMAAYLLHVAWFG